MIDITTDPTRMDVGAIHRFLSEESYWAKDIPRTLMELAMQHSLCFAALDGEATVGFARVVTDHATFGYIADVFVLPSHRGRGIARQIMEAIAAHPSLQGLRRLQLVTRDAHGLYAQFGFAPLASPDRHLEKVVRDAYRQQP
jgi:N-acetylglutamate synthase-like GNAT family acetyltransferase